ncbi:hypothetical protein [Bacillus amyloliquefaciens]|uniref:hypothetical protein n=1 Tax=Bacillus amyloliquefaciens TaxID=1390 RepID=UPI000E254C08|nr:hypothetical protein [Bacillus amyloliquefaciens]RDY83190.1 hypothetical protein C3733_20240 [Bacillus amyloliquefaciens]
MEKYAIRLCDNSYEAHLIFHATPTFSKFNPYELYEYQWYLTEDENQEGTPIEKEQYESYITTTELTKQKGYDGLYLYCKYRDINTNQVFKTEYIRLYSNVNKIIESGTIFDKISVYDSTGHISS